MFQNISAINYLIYSVGLGFIAAIIITNIQRSALSKFINSLISNNCYSPDSSTTLTDINLKGINACIIKSAVKNQFGLKKSISVVCESVKSKDKLEEIFDKTDDVKYYLSENCDLELLKKRYNYSALSKMPLTLLIAALIAVVLIASILSDIIIKSISKPKLEENPSNDSQIEETTENDTFDENTSENSSENSVDKESIESEPSSESDVSTPRVPVG